MQIITFLFVFSIALFSPSVQAGYIDELLEFDAGPEAFEINTQSIDDLSFQNDAVEEKFNEFKKVAKELKTALIVAYADERFDYNQMQGIIKNYNSFIFHTNKFFYFISEKEKYSESKDLSQAISRNYKLSRSYFKKLKSLYNK